MRTTADPITTTTDSTTRPTIWCIGYSTRSAEEFNHILKSHQIQRLADVRAFPASRRHPQFNKDELAKVLANEGMEYHHVAKLGGRRRPSPDSKNIAWTNPSFRAYADYMETDEFQRGIAILIELGLQRPLVVMCAEAVWWRCHRSLIADYLKTKGWKVVHIISATRSEEHRYTAAATVLEGKLSYAGVLREADGERQVS